MATQLVRIEGLQGVMKTLKELPPEVVSSRGGPVRRSLRKASKIMIEQMKANIQQIMDTPNVGYHDEHTGLLLKNIYTKRMKMQNKKGESYRVGPRVRKKYPKKSVNSKEVTVVQVGRLLETGTEKRPPYPWARPAFDARKNEVIPIFVMELKKDLGRIQKKLAKKNGVG